MSLFADTAVLKELSIQIPSLLAQDVAKTAEKRSI